MGRAVLGVRVYGSAAISFAKILSGRLLTYVTYLQPWDYAAAMRKSPSGFALKGARGLSFRQTGKAPPP